jgi:hypothetical protein
MNVSAEQVNRPKLPNAYRKGSLQRVGHFSNPKAKLLDEVRDDYQRFV